MDNIKHFAKNEKELEPLIQTIRIYCQDLGMQFCVGKYGALIMKSGNFKLGKFQVLGNIGSRHHQTNGDEGKNNKRVPQKNEKTSGNQTLQHKYIGNIPCKIPGTILKMDQGRLQTNGPDD